MKRFKVGYDLILFVGIVLAFSAWVLSLPCFPSTDGPVHLYFADILATLLSHRSSGYSDYFYIRHLLPPYAVYYYALALISRCVPMFLADKLMICTYFVLFAFGVRYLAQAVGGSGKMTSMMATLLLLNWPLGMGFVSFCLSLALALWGAGLWLRTMGHGSHGGRVAFALLCVLILLAHPVPLLLLLTVAAIFLAIRFLIAGTEAGQWAWPAHGRADLLTLGAASLTLLYLLRFSTVHPFDQHLVITPSQYLHDGLDRFILFGREHSLAFLLGRGPDIFLYRAVLLLILLGPMALACSQFVHNRRNGLWTHGDTFFILGCLVLVALPFIPAKLNDCFYFPDRLLICLWLSFLMAASAWSPSQHSLRWLHPALGGLRLDRQSALAIGCFLAVFGDGMLLHASNRLLRPVANTVAALGQSQGFPRGQVGFLLEDARKEHDCPHESLAWDPYYWALVHVFRQNGDIMANAPWVDESIIPVAPSTRLPEMSIAALRQPIPSLLQNDLLRAPQDLRRTLAIASFYMVNQAERPNPPDEPLLRAMEGAQPAWTCVSEGWYRLCQPSPRKPGQGGPLLQRSSGRKDRQRRETAR